MTIYILYDTIQKVLLVYRSVIKHIKYFSSRLLTIQISEIYNSIDNDEYCREKQGTAEGIRRVDRVRGIETLNRELLLDTLRR